MQLKAIAFFSFLSLLPGLSMATIISNQYYALTSNSYYSYNYTDWSNGSGDIVDYSLPLTGLLHVSIDNTYAVTIDYSNVLINGNPFRATDTLLTDINGVQSQVLLSGITGEPDYLAYGNAALTPFPQICIECSYEMNLNLGANPYSGNPVVLSYHESNPYDSGESHFVLYVSQVPLPAAAWLFGSGLLGLLAVTTRKRSATGVISAHMRHRPMHT